jgi:DNA-binding transcriptional LysR family regulator
MAPTPALDLDLVRTLVLIAEEKSFTRAAQRVGRTQSAVSLQVQRLEGLLGHRLIVRGKGGRVELTPHGEELVERGRALLALNDEIIQSVHARKGRAAVRLGFSEALTRPILPDILAAFAEAQPTTTVEINTRGSSCELVPMLKAGELDLLVCEGGHEPRQWPAVELLRTRLEWITSDAYRRHIDDPLPLSLSSGNCPLRPPWLDECIWRGAALRALERAGRRHKIVSTSGSTAGQLAAVQAGIAVTVATSGGLPEGLRPTRPEEGLPELPEVSLLLLKAREPRQPATDALFEHIVEAYA